MTASLALGSLFAGIGGFELAASRAGLRTAWSAEIDPQCRAVLHRQFGGCDYTIIQDVRDVTTADHIRPSIISAGWPCQGNSVAGRRAGMADARSGLWREVVRVLAEFRPLCFLGENVPGLLSVNGGLDMATVLADLAQLGYGFAYRILDAQCFGVAQRRRRVFIVGCLGNWRRAAEILFEPESLPWDSPPSREAGSRTAACLTAGVASGRGVNRPGRRREDDSNIVACPVISPALEARDCKGPSSDGDGDGAPLIAHTLRGEGFDASEDGTGRGTPLVPIAYAIQERASSENLSNGPGGKGYSEGIAYTLEARHHTQAIAYRTSGNCGVTEQGDKTAALNCATDPTQQIVQSRYGVRRLTPRECERLMGFPDDYTRYDSRGKEISDSARYRMIGNSVAVPCVEWILRRISQTITEAT